MRTLRRLTKLRRDPELFFGDARWGRLVGPLPRLLSRPAVHRVLLDPVEGLAALRWPLVGSLAQRALARRGAARRARIAVHGDPLVSIVIAARDAEDTIEAALSSILAQTHSKLEVIVVDDASSDLTLARARAIAAFDARVVVQEAPGHRGPAWCRNLGLTVARGAFSSFHDADDVSHPTKIERQLATLLAHPEAVVCLCGYARQHADGRWVRIDGRLVGKSIISMLIRREVVERVGFLQERRVAEDAEYYERILATYGPSSERLILAPLYFARYRADSLLFGGRVEIAADGSVTHRRTAEEEEAIAEMRRRIEGIQAGEIDPYVSFEP